MNTIDELKRETANPVVVADQQGLVVYVNQRFEAAFGWQPKDILGKPLTVIIPKHLHDAHQLGFSRFLTSGKPTLLEQPLLLKAVTKDGQEFQAEHFIIAQRQGSQWSFGAIIRPVGEPGPTKL